MFMKKKIKFRLGMKTLFKALLSTILMTLCVILVMNLKLSNTVGLFIEVLCGGLIYLITSIALKNEMVFEILQKVKGKIVHKV